MPNSAEFSLVIDRKTVGTVLIDRKYKQLPVQCTVLCVIKNNIGGVVKCTAQWCIFNNFSLDKHRHYIWDHFLSFTSWNNKLALNFATNDHKNSPIGNYKKNSTFFYKEKSLYIFECMLLFWIAIFLLFCSFSILQVLVVYFDTSLFFSWIKIPYCL